MIRRMIIFFVILAAVLALLHTSLLVVHTHQYAVLYRSNNIQRVITKPGVYLKQPAFLQKVRLLDKRVLTSSGETAQHALNTADNHKLMATWYVQWKIEEPMLYAQKFGYRDTIVKETLHEIIRNGLQDIVQQNKSAHWLGAARSSLDTQLQRLVQTAADSQKLGLRIQTIRLIRLDISPAQAKQAQIEMAQSIQSNQQQLQANMQQELAQLKETAAQSYGHIIEQARQDAARIRAEGDAAAIEIYAKDYAKNPELAKYLQSLSLYQQTFNKQQDTLVLDPTKAGLFSQLQRNQDTLQKKPLRDTE